MSHSSIAADAMASRRNAPGRDNENGLSVVIQMADDVCSSEPIHAPGAIQPHGVMMVLSLSDLSYLGCSANLAGLCPSFAPGGGIKWLPDEVRAVLATLAGDDAEQEATVVASIPDLGPRAVHCFRSGSCAFVEWDVVQSTADLLLAPELAQAGRNALQRFNGAETLYLAGRELVDAIRAITGYDRVLLYRFDAEDNGDVIAESLAGDWPQSLMGLHFPASDIPTQVRALYRRVAARWTPLRDYDPVELVSADHSRFSYDLSFSDYRSVSPVHTLYQRNLGVDGAMTLSILREGQLWGLVVGHHRTSRHVPYATRQLTRNLVDAFAIKLSALSISGEAKAIINHTNLQTRLLSKLAGSDDFVAAMSEPPLVATDMFADCTGAAIVYRDDRRRIMTRLVGNVAPPEKVLRLMEWLRAYSPEPVVSTDCISSIFPAFSSYEADCSGVLAAFFGEDRDQAILWFRPEVVREVSWGGRPEKVLDVNGTTYLPRRSFEKWVEKKHGHSEPWHLWEKQVAGTLATTLSKVILRQNRKIRDLNGEVEHFLWVTSHHLQEAPRRILIGCQQLVRYLGPSLMEQSALHIHDIQHNAQDLALRLAGILAYWEYGHNVVVPQAVELGNIFEATKTELEGDIGKCGATIRILGSLPTVMGDRRGLMFVFRSLISNALEYSAPGQPIDINIWAEKSDGEWIIAVGDNGIGIDKDFHERVFNFFETLRPVGESKGIGLGLTLCRRIIEKLDGRIWLNSTPGVGTTVFFALRAQPDNHGQQGDNGINILTLLRDATRPLHAAVESVPTMQPLRDGRVTADQYRGALSALYGFYRPAEELIFEAFPRMGDIVPIRPKLPALIHDLTALGMTEQDVLALPICTGVSRPATLAGCLGMAYVLEGATLGGQVVLRRIAHCLGDLTPLVTAFHNFHGHQAGPHWQSFTNGLNKQIGNSPLAQQNAVDAAVATFKSLILWLEQYSPR